MKENNRILFLSIIFIILFSMFSLSAIANKEYYSDKQYVKMNLTILAMLRITPTSPQYSIDYVRSHLMFYPRDDVMQKVNSLATTHKADEIDDSLYYEWLSPDPGDIKFGYSADLLVRNTPPKVKQKINYPLKFDFDPEIEKYILPTKNIDSDHSSIINLASNLAQGEDDVYIIAHKLASWTKQNIEYNLSTVTASVSQSASWTLKNRMGVCDELTSLFVAMLRSLGVPARFVSGISYTSSDLFAQNWGPHGWAEVYFPDVGWIPFDPTYGQYGFVDPSHIKLKQSADPEDTTTKFEWKSRNVDIKPIGSLEVSVDAYEFGRKINPPISIKPEFFKNGVGFGSYQLLEVQVVNLMDYYVATTIYLYTPDELKIIGNHEQSIALTPREQNTLFWIVKVDDNLNEDLIYSFPVKILSSRNVTADAVFNSYFEYPGFSYEDMKQFMDQRKEEKAKSYSTDVILNCSPEKDVVYVNDEVKIFCYFKNSGNTILSNLSICLEEDCEYHSIGINQGFQENFLVQLDNIGTKQITIVSRNQDFSKISTIDLEVLDSPEIKIANISYPLKVVYNDKFKFNFTLLRESKSSPQNVSVILNLGGRDNEWNFDSLDQHQQFIIDMNSKSFGFGKTSVKIIVDYSDKKGRKYAKNEEVFIELINLNFWQKIKVSLNSMSRKIEIFFDNMIK